MSCVAFLTADAFYSEKCGLETVAAAKIKQITAELEKTGSEPFDAVERIKTGFGRFKTEKYEYVLFYGSGSFLGICC